METLKEKFDRKIRITPGCWLWQAGKFSQGYGALYYDGKTQYAHRVAYKLYVGDIPDGMDLMHTCDNPGCCNPHHVVPGTVMDNMTDKVEKGRDESTRGLNHWKGKLTDDQVRGIFLDGRKPKQIAQEYGVTVVTVYQIKHRQTRVKALENL